MSHNHHKKQPTCPKGPLHFHSSQFDRRDDPRASGLFNAPVLKAMADRIPDAAMDAVLKKTKAVDGIIEMIDEIIAWASAEHAHASDNNVKRLKAPKILSQYIKNT